MKKILLASACMFVLSSAGAMAQQNQPAPGASGQGEVGPGAASGSNMKPHATTGTGAGMTQPGDGQNKTDSRNPSSQGNAGPGTDHNVDHKAPMK